MIKNFKTTTILGSKCYVYWVHSGGANAPASEARMEMMEATLRLHKQDGVAVIVMFSGEATRKGHDFDQAQLLADAFTKEKFDFVTVRAIPLGMEEAYRILIADYPGAEFVKFFCELPYMWPFLERLHDVDPVYRRRIKPVTFDIYDNALYMNAHSVNDIPVRSSAMLFMTSMKRVGLSQVLLKWVELKVGNKSTKNPVKRLIIKVVIGLLRKDLRG